MISLAFSMLFPFRKEPSGALGRPRGERDYSCLSRLDKFPAGRRQFPQQIGGDHSGIAETLGRSRSAARPCR